MKDAKFTLEFTRHVLANSFGPDEDQAIFQRDSKDNLIFSAAWFFSMFTKAIEISHIRGIKASDIHINLGINAPTELYKRRYGGDKYRTHEAIMPGTKVTFEAIVSDHVTQSNLSVILEKAGKFVGLSPFGYRLGYGLFSVLHIEVSPSDSDAKDKK